MKKIILLLFIFTLVFSFSTANAMINGDMNRDGQITIVDVRLLLQLCINGGWEEEEESLDGFYAVMSNGVRRVVNPETGESALKIRLANASDPEGTMYTFASKFQLSDFDGTAIEEDVVYDNAEGNNGNVVFVYAKFNSAGKIDDITLLADGVTAEIGEDEYSIVEFSGEYDNVSNYIITDDEDYKITNNTTAFMLTPLLDEDDNSVVGFDFRVADDPKTALVGVTKGLIGYMTTSPINQNGDKTIASHVFVMEDAFVPLLEVAKVEKVRERAGISYVQLNDEWEEVDFENAKSIVDAYQGGTVGNVSDLIKSIIVYNKTAEDKVVIRGAFTNTDLVGASIVQAVESSIVQFVEGPLDGDIDLTNNNDLTNKAYEDYQIVHVDASVNKDNEVEFEDVEVLGTGLPAGRYIKGDRVVVDDTIEVIYITTIEGVDDEDLIEEENGAAVVTYKEDIVFHRVIEFAEVDGVRNQAGVASVMIDNVWEPIDFSNEESVVSQYSGGATGNAEDLNQQFIAYFKTEEEKVVVLGIIEVAEVEGVRNQAGVASVMINSVWEEVDFTNEESIVSQYSGGTTGNVEDLELKDIAFFKTFEGKVVIIREIKGLEVALVERVKYRAGVSYAYINGEWEEVYFADPRSIVDAFEGGLEGNVKDLDKQFITFVRRLDDKIVITGVMKTTDLVGASIVKAVDGTIIQFVEGDLEGDIDLEDLDGDVNKAYEDYKIIHIDASVNKDNEVELEDGEILGTGLPAGRYIKGDRVVVDDTIEVIYITTIEGVDDEDLISNVNGIAVVTYYEDL